MDEALRLPLLLVSLALALVLVSACLSAFGLVGLALWPGPARAVRARVSARPRMCLLLGLLEVALFVLVAATLGRAAPGGRLLVVLLAAFAVWLLLAGLPGMLALLGERIEAFAGRRAHRLRAVVVGTVALVGASVLPWVGQALLVGVLAMVLGGATAALIGRARPDAASRAGA